MDPQLTLHIRNIPVEINVFDLKETFEKLGIVVDFIKKRPEWNFAFIQCHSPERRPKRL